MTKSTALTPTEFRVLGELTAQGQSCVRLANILNLDSFAVAQALWYLEQQGKAVKESTVGWIRKPRGCAYEHRVGRPADNNAVECGRATVPGSDYCEKHLGEAA